MQTLSLLRGVLMRRALPWSGALGYPLGQAYRLLEQTADWPRDRLAARQGQALQQLLTHCYKHVPYYRDTLAARGLTPADFQKPEDLAKLPYLTRDIIREQGERLRADNYPDRVCQFRRSGGTTGEPIRIALNRRARAFEVAAYLRGFQWMGYRLGAPMVRLFGGSLGLAKKPSAKTKLREWLLHSRFLPAFELAPGNVRDYYRAIERSPGGSLVGYASAALNLSQYMRRAGLRGSPLASVICTAEYMPPSWRAEIRETLEAPVFCYYGCGEVTGVAHERAGETGYIVAEEHIVLEAANGEPAEFRQDGHGQVCLTTLYNYAMPLIRYLNGDTATLAPDEAPEPRHLRIAEMGGRVVEQLSGARGQRISGIFVPHLVFQSGCPVWKYQLVQESLDRILFRYALHDRDQELTDAMRETLSRLFREHLGPGLSIEFVKGQFELTRSGKHRIVINRMPAADPSAPQMAEATR